MAKLTGGWWRSAVRLWYYFSKFLPLLHISVGPSEPGGQRGRSPCPQILADQLTLYQPRGQIMLPTLCPPPLFSPGVHRSVPHKKETVFIMTFMRLFSLGNNICEYSNNFGVSIFALSSNLRLTILI